MAGHQEALLRPHSAAGSAEGAEEEGGPFIPSRAAARWAAALDAFLAGPLRMCGGAAYLLLAAGSPHGLDSPRNAARHGARQAFFLKLFLARHATPSGHGASAGPYPACVMNSSLSSHEVGLKVFD